MSGTFVTFEGGEGSGKSTQLRLVAARLRSAGLTVLELREPGGTAAGEAIRKVLLDPALAGLDSRAELLLYEAARAQLVAEVIRPALDADYVVLCDRFFDSTTAYQGYARGLDLAEIGEMNLSATGGLVPDRTVVLDVDPMLGIERATRQGADRLESESIAFHQRVREGFLAIAEQETARVRVVDASGDVAQVAARIVEQLADLPQLEEAL